MSDNNLSWFWERLAEFGERTFLLTGDVEFSYAELIDVSCAYLSELQSNHVGPESIIALISDFSPEGVAALFACIKVGCVVAPVVTNKPAEIESRIKEGAVTHVWRVKGKQSVIEKIKSPVATPALVRDLQQADHPGLILFSSGSSGQPKAMLHDLVELLNSYQKRRPKKLRILAFLMFDHIGGLHTMLGAMASGAALVIPSTREPEAIAEAVERHRAAVLPASPSFLSLLLMSEAHLRHDLSSLRIVSYGTEPMPASLLERLRATLPKARLIQTFGTSETGISQTVSRSSSSLALRIDDPNTEYKIVDGELWLKSGTQIKGYLNVETDRFTEDGWFKTGDLVDELEDGYLRIKGRSSDIINVAGEKVFPAEVESVVMELSEVSDCLALAEPNSITGQSVSIQVVAKPGKDVSELRREIRRHCRQRLDRYKNPTRIAFTEKTSIGDRFKRNRRLAAEH
ncbi:class I adenylate-forming enzyme family protein [Rubellicoccus peritrichatus]|uniref:Class I adenylate-forming enzyme family protein n=1 Tax=Rubellicoccus peritrichatus TaxID=3080537 RepID=A0AAQ3LE31_9BACT|nr:class I adenylate-forming enzyme family protein [Puniceicoccus sp. CR14]WOO42937.1 class I adenylate-forming enzyme family protein [Puniceicoccus sp. CR14]